MRHLALVALFAGCHHDPPQYVPFDASPRPDAMVDAIPVDAAETCAQDSDCSYGACAEQFGSCTASARTLFVRMSGTDEGDCIAAPCKTIAFALTKVAAGNEEYTIALGAGPHATTAALDVSNKNVRLSGPGPAHFPNFPTTADPAVLAIITGGAGRSTITGTGGTLTLENLGLTAAPVGEHAVDLTNTNVGLFDVVAGGNGGGVIAATGTSANVFRGEGLLFANETVVPAPALRLDQEATLLRVIVANHEPAFQISKRLAVQNAVIGGGPTAFLTMAGAETSVADYVTLLPTATIVSGPVPVAISSSIVATAATTTGATYSFTMFPVGTTPIPGPVGSENFAGAPAFVDIVPAGGIDLHLQPTSAAIGRANTATSTSVDLENRARPFPSGSRADCGAYEERTITPAP